MMLESDVQMAIDAPLSVTDDYLKKSWCVLIATLGDDVAETTAVVKMEDLRDNTLAKMFV
jgi:hypothetical protein